MAAMPLKIESTDDPRYVKINGEMFRVFSPSKKFLKKHKATVEQVDKDKE